MSVNTRSKTKAVNNEDEKDPESYDEAEEPRASGAPAAAVASPGHARPAVNTETFLAGIMESFARMQAETNRTLVETLRTLPFNGSGPWSPPSAAATPPPDSRAPSCLLAAAAAGGNFSKCTARFDGRSRDAEVLEAFIDAVQVYKECASVSDEHALRGPPLLLEGDAAVWWRGARAGAASWPAAVARLRSMYGVQQPAHKVFREIFSAEQKDSEGAEVFVCKVRSLLTKLPYEVPTCMQIDIIYGLLHRRVRKRLPRDSIVDVDNFVEKARAIEDAISEVKVSTYSPTPNAANSTSSTTSRALRSSEPPREFRETTAERSVTIGPHGTTGSKLTSNSNENLKRDKRVRCSYCKFYGHVVADCRNLQNRESKQHTVNADSDGLVSYTGPNPIRCYGCGTPGVVKSKCSSKNEPAKSYDFNVVIGNDVADVSQKTETSHPIVSITIANRVGVAVLDTGATCSVAGFMLSSILRSDGIQFHEAERTIGLADGSRQQKIVEIATVPVLIEGRQVTTEFVVFPGENTRTLLGSDFISNAGLTLVLDQGSWFFSDRPDHIFPFVRSVHLKDTEQSVEFLGHVIVSGGMVDPDKTAAIANMPPPQNVKHLKCFLQTSSRSRRFIPHYAKIAAPLTTLLEKVSTWRWGPEQQGAFDTIKSLLVSAPILCQADETKPFVLRTDGSGYALGAALLQGEGVDERPVEYASRLCTAAKKNYPEVSKIVEAPVRPKRRRGRPRRYLHES